MSERFGSGKDGNAVFDGENDVEGCTRSGCIYVATRDLHFNRVAIEAGVLLDLHGHHLFARDCLDLSGSGLVRG